MHVRVILYCILISAMGFICIPESTHLPFSRLNSQPNPRLDLLPNEEITVKEKINGGFQFPFDHSHLK